MKTDRSNGLRLSRTAAILGAAVLLLVCDAGTAAFAQDEGGGSDVDPTCVAAGITDADACAGYLANAQPPADEPAVEEPAPEEPVVEEPTPEEPAVEEPAPEEPVVEEPAPEEPVLEEPAPEEPVVDEPTPEEPVVDEPAPDEPAVDEPAPDEPAVDVPADDAPVADDPATDAPAVDAPVADEPAVDVPADEPAVDETPADGPSVDAMSEAPVLDEPPANDDATGDAPSSDDAVSDETPSDESAVDTISSEAPLADESSLSERPVDDSVSSAEPVSSAEASTAPDETPELAVDDPAAQDDAAFTSTDAPPDAAFTEDTPVAVDAEGQQVEPIADLPPGTDPADVEPITDSGKSSDGPAEAPQAPEFVPSNDVQAQTFAAPPVVDPVADQKPTHVDTPPPFAPPQGVTVIDQTTNVYQVNNTIVVNNIVDDRDRLAYDSSRVDYLTYPNGRSTETVYRDDGSEVTTIYDRYGNVISRTVTDADGYDYRLAYYDPAYEEDERMYWGDPGRDLPPLRITVGLGFYIFNYDRYDLADLTRFLFLPPVEPIRHLYSIDEVKRSPRLRDAVPRVEIGDLTFASGAWDVTPKQVPKLKKLATAILAVLKKNRAETFLIEGHTDAVGSDRDNLVLSDDRARAVAGVLSKYFHVPPENLVTQGYGERFLKVKTQGPADANRRVVVRRITSLIMPAK